ncbi:MAG: Nif3-like dinuclear metal center hexameric protein [Cytophagales bacterium]|nr:Nif3-like dinuclear metal center hexameric protein [Cytophagales bacterium]
MPTTQTYTNARLLDQFLSELLQPERLKDFCPNGWQVEGKSEIKKIVSGVTASQAFIDAAIEAKADAIFVHHGLFWRGETRITGWMRKRLGALLEHNINLFAYHLPLDAHPTLGNNAQLAKVLGFQPIVDENLGRFGEQKIGWLGTTKAGSLAELQTHIEQRLGRSVLAIGDGTRSIQKIAWCTGGAQNYFEAAIAAGADAYVTGEISEPQAHYAREMGVAYIACGHHATERYGAPAVAAFAAEHFGLQHSFIDIDNPA